MRSGRKKRQVSLPEEELLPTVSKEAAESAAKAVDKLSELMRRVSREEYWIELEKGNGMSVRKKAPALPSGVIPVRVIAIIYFSSDHTGLEFRPGWMTPKEREMIEVFCERVAPRQAPGLFQAMKRPQPSQDETEEEEQA